MNLFWWKWILAVAVIDQFDSYRFSVIADNVIGDMVFRNHLSDRSIFIHNVVDADLAAFCLEVFDIGVQGSGLESLLRTTGGPTGRMDNNLCDWSGASWAAGHGLFSVHCHR